MWKAYLLLLLSNPIAVAATLLGVVHSNICAVDNAICILTVIGIDADSDARSNDQLGLQAEGEREQAQGRQ